MLEDIGLPTPAPGSAPLDPARKDAADMTLAVHDPCTTRSDEGVQDAVRRLIAKLGVRAVELGYARGTTTCCGYGGLMKFANPEVADRVVRRRIAENDADYVTYCAMCRDEFSARGKRSLHVLDLVYGTAGADPAGRRGPTFSQRHENRARLKAEVLRNVWGEHVADGGQHMKLVISPEVQALMEKRMILLEEVETVIAHAEASGEKIEDGASGHLIASHRPVSVTYWVEYSAEGSGEPSGFVVHNVYSHRMDVSGSPAT